MLPDCPKFTAAYFFHSDDGLSMTSVLKFQMCRALSAERAPFMLNSFPAYDPLFTCNLKSFLHLAHVISLRAAGLFLFP